MLSSCSAISCKGEMPELSGEAWRILLVVEIPYDLTFALGVGGVIMEKLFLFVVRIRDLRIGWEF